MSQIIESSQDIALDEHDSHLNTNDMNVTTESVDKKAIFPMSSPSTTMKRKRKRKRYKKKLQGDIITIQNDQSIIESGLICPSTHLSIASETRLKKKPRSNIKQQNELVFNLITQVQEYVCDTHSFKHHQLGQIKINENKWIVKEYHEENRMKEQRINEENQQQTNNPLDKRHTSIQHLLEFYLSDSNILHDKYLQNKLGLMTSIQLSNPLSQKNKEYSHQDIPFCLNSLYNKLFYFIQLFNWNKSEVTHEDHLMKTNMFTIDNDKHHIYLTDQEKHFIRDTLYHQPETIQNNQKTESCHYWDGYIWMNANEFLKFNKLKVLNTTLTDIIYAAKHSTQLRIHYFYSSTYQKWIALIQQIHVFITGKEWDKSYLGHIGLKTQTCNHVFTSPLDPHFITFQKCIELFEIAIGLKSSTVLTDVESNDISMDSSMGQWKIGRIWDKNQTLESLEDIKNSCSVFMDNIPFKCTVDHLREMIKIETQLEAKHISAPRFAISRENKGFCFIELKTQEDMMTVVNTLNGMWPGIWFKPNRGPLKSCCTQSHNQRIHNHNDFEKIIPELDYTRLIPRNRRPLIVTPHSVWKEKKEKLKALNNERNHHHVIHTDSITPSLSQHCWIDIHPVISPISLLAITQFIQHTVIPLSVRYMPKEEKASALLSSVEDALKLRFDVSLSGRTLGHSTYTNIIIPELKVSSLDS